MRKKGGRNKGSGRPPGRRRSTSRRRPAKKRRPARKVALVKRKAHRPPRLRRARPHRLRHGVRSPKPAAVKKGKFRLAGIDAEHRPEIERLLAKVYRDAALALRSQEAREQAVQNEREAAARSELIKALQAWEAKQARPATQKPRS